MFTFQEATLTEARVGVDLNSLGVINMQDNLQFDFAVQVVDQNYTPLPYDDTYYTLKVFQKFNFENGTSKTEYVDQEF